MDGHHPAQAIDMGQTSVFSTTSCESVTSTCSNSDSGGSPEPSLSTPEGGPIPEGSGDHYIPQVREVVV